jgi:hypothetical protein
MARLERCASGAGTAERLTSFGMRAGLALLAVCLGSRPLGGHHDFRTEFDAKQRVTLRGVVTRIEWVNPHAWLYVGVSGAPGETVEWAIQAASPEALVRRGWQKDSVKPGTPIVVDAFRARSGKAVANGRDVTLPDGRMLCANLPCRCCSAVDDRQPKDGR